MSLQRGIRFGAVTLTDYPFMAEFGMDYAAGDLVTSVLSSFLQDGDLEVSQRRGNMTLTIPLLVEGSDLLELAQAEALLAGEAQKATNTLSIDPGDGIAPSTVFDTFQGDVAFAFDDDMEMSSMRRLVLTIRALPFGRSVEQATTSATPQSLSPVTTSINDGSSAADWTGPDAVTVASGSVTAHATDDEDVFLQYTSAISLTGTGLIYVDWRTTGAVATSPSMQVVVAGISRTMRWVSTAASPAATFTRSYFEVPPDVTAATAVRFGAGVAGGAGADLFVTQVTKTNQPPMIGTYRQQVLVAEVAGTARTQATILLRSATAALGDAVVYTHANTPDAYVPTLTQFAVAGSPARTSAPTLVSGAYTTLSTSSYVMSVPAASLAPGLYSIVARVWSPAGDDRSLSLAVFATMNGTIVGRTATLIASLEASATYQFLPLGCVDLPSVGFRGSTAGMQSFSLRDTTSGGTAARLDELYAFNLTTGRLTMVSCGVGAPGVPDSSSRLWLDSATVASRTPSVMLGVAADGSDAHFAGDKILCPSQHEVATPSTKVFTVTTNATDAELDFQYYPRWLGHAAS